MSSEVSAVEKVLQVYFDGRYEGDTKKLGEVFHSASHLYAAGGDGKVEWLDGISVTYPDWHFNVRASNTEPLLRLNLESVKSHADMEQRRDEILNMIRA